MFSKKWCTLLVVATFYISLTLSAPTEIPEGINESTTNSIEDSVVTTNIPQVELKSENSTEKFKNTTIKNVNESETTTESSEVEIKSDEAFTTTQTSVIGIQSSTEFIGDNDEITSTIETTEKQPEIDGGLTAELDDTVRQNRSVTIESTTMIPGNDDSVTTTQIVEVKVESTAHSEDRNKNVTAIPEEKTEVTEVNEKIDETIIVATRKPIESTTTSVVDHADTMTQDTEIEVASRTHSEDRNKSVTEIPEEKTKVTEVNEKIDETIIVVTRKPIESTTALVNDHDLVTSQVSQHDITTPTLDVDVHSTTEIDNENVSTTNKIPDKLTTNSMIELDNISTTQASKTTNSSMVDSILKVAKIPDVISTIKNNLPRNNGATFSNTFNFYLIISASLLTYITFLNL